MEWDGHLNELEIGQRKTVALSPVARVAYQGMPVLTDAQKNVHMPAATAMVVGNHHVSRIPRYVEVRAGDQLRFGALLLGAMAKWVRWSLRSRARFVTMI